MDERNPILRDMPTAEAKVEAKARAKKMFRNRLKAAGRRAFAA
ncbi:hypothetical protein ACSET8_02635 [Pseudomonas aeruginosa]|uniref:Transcriptional regulator n=1 Tax=Pseudomonas citronellolis TaxID=53408 RepID=A0AAW6P5Q0_9PSED|nr:MULTISPECIES: hypothetical protein [Pseudomonas aeruginosa group]MDF3842773.1 hypothetical protein [Pseudomonas citronellolis]MDU0508410.1 hypothetical protein [Pseudomonas aeruginosa]